MKRILIVGGGGFIGGHLVRSLLADGVRVRVLDNKPVHGWHQVSPEAENIVGDVAERDVAEHAVNRCDEVFNLACDMGGMGFIEHNKALCMLSVLADTQVLRAAQQAGVKRFFYSSTACVYPQDRQSNTEALPLRESDAYPADPEDGYGWQKLFGERLCRHFSEDFGIETRVARYHNVYGPECTWQGGREKAPAALCRKIAIAKLTGERIIDVWGDGEQTRSFLSIGDCVRASRLLMDSDVSTPLNVGSEHIVSINDLISIIEDIAGITVERRYDLAAPQGVRGRSSDNGMVRELLDWEPTTDLTDGLRQTYEWIEHQVRDGGSSCSPTASSST